MRILLTIGLVLGMLHGANAADTYASMKNGTAATVLAPEPNPFAGLYAGLSVGGQFTDITLTDGSQELFSGISADGFVYGGHIGYNFPVGQFVAGPYAEFAFSDVAVSVLGEDILTMDDYVQLGAMIGARTSKSTLVSIHAAREWQTWTAGGAFGLGETEADVTAWVIGAGIDTMVATNVSVGVKLDYVMLDSIDAAGHSFDRYLEDTDALRATARLTYRPNTALPSLESIKF
jgi:outer membrane immunogenic protein